MGIVEMLRSRKMEMRNNGKEERWREKERKFEYETKNREGEERLEWEEWRREGKESGE